jgi:hypothetical protein
MLSVSAPPPPARPVTVELSAVERLSIEEKAWREGLSTSAWLRALVSKPTDVSLISLVYELRALARDVQRCLPATERLVTHLAADELARVSELAAQAGLSVSEWFRLEARGVR